MAAPTIVPSQNDDANLSVNTSYSRDDGRRMSRRYTREEIDSILIPSAPPQQPLESVLEVDEETPSGNPVSLSNIIEGSFTAHEQPLEQPVAADVKRMSIKELKSFIIEHGGNLSGCEEKTQLECRALNYV